MNPRSVPLMVSGLGAVYGAVQFIRGLSNHAGWGIQMAWVALFVVGVLCAGYFLRHDDP